MNRHARRAAAARARRQPGYQHRFLAALNTLDVRPGEIGHVHVEHDDGCTYDAGRCTCTPDITRRVGGRLQRIGLDGGLKETPLC